MDDYSRKIPQLHAKQIKHENLEQVVRRKDDMHKINEVCKHSSTLRFRIVKFLPHPSLKVQFHYKNQLFSVQLRNKRKVG